MKRMQMCSVALVCLLCLIALLPLLAQQTLPQLPKPGVTMGSQIKTLSIINSSNVANLRERTKVQLIDLSKSSALVPWAQSTAAGDLVLVVTTETDKDYGSRTNQLRAYRTADGTLSWTLKEQYPPSDHAAHSFDGPIVTDTLTLMLADSGKLRAYDTLTGALRWTTSPGDIRLTVVILPNVYYYTFDGLSYLNAIDPRNGNLLWKSGSIGPGPDPGPPVILADGSIVNSSDDGLRAYGQRMSSVRWTVNPVPPLLHYAPAIMGGTVYSSSNSALYAVGLADGKIIWKYDSGGITFNSPVITGNQGLVYIMCYETVGPGNMLYAFNAATGALAWKVAALGPQKTTSICVCNDVVFVAGWQLSAFNAKTGAKLWQMPSTEGAFFWVTPAGHSLLVATTGLSLHIYS